MYSEKFEAFEEIIQELMMVYKHDKRPWLIGFSGGKDSTLLCTLVMNMISRLPKKERIKKVYIISSDTMVENPIVCNYMHKMSAMINDNCKELNIHAEIIYPKIENTFWCKVIGLGYPTPEAPGFRWCTDRLKIQPVTAYTNDVIKNNGEIIILLGVRKGESVYRANNIKAREIEGKLLVPHVNIENAYVYNPLTEIPNSSVWEFLLMGDAKSPWGSDNKYLFSLYQGEDLGEENSVVGEIDKVKIPVTGNSRFGCWICTMVKEDKSLKNFIGKGATWLVPLRDFRNWLMEYRSNPAARETKRRNGSVHRRTDGSLQLGPFTLEARKEILRRLLRLEKQTKMQLITENELKYIDTLWDNEGDLTRRSLVNIYHEETGKYLPWDEYKTSVFDEDVIQEIKNYCCEYNVEFELISKLIVAIETNKNYTRSNAVSKAFDKILNQGWLHFESIERGLNNDN